MEVHVLINSLHMLSLLLLLSPSSPFFPRPPHLTSSPSPSLSLSPSTGFRIRWLVESYLGLKHVPFEHFACSTECATKLNNNFQKIQSKLRKQHDQAYQTMLDQYADDASTTRQTRRRGFLHKKKKELEVREMWCADFRQWSTSQRRRQQRNMTSSRAQCQECRHSHRGARRRRAGSDSEGGTSCTIM